jgi:4-diphosphocytidyl-2-C-methyl-D-erythritol kinase
MIVRTAPAKLNLTLEVLGERADGYHEIRSVMQTISLADRIALAPADDLTFESDAAEWSAGKSLVSQAAALLKRRTGAARGASILVEKRVPLLSGLGGDSSDAAAVLMGLNELWELGLTRGELVSVGSQLGSDVAFFFLGGTALVAGRGEKVTALPPVSHQWIVVVVPPGPRLPGKTAALYQALTANHYTDGQTTQRMAGDIRAGKDLDLSLLFNTFESVAFTLHPGLAVIRQHILKMGAGAVHLAGSGPVMFIVCSDRVRADELSSALNGQQLAAHLTETAVGKPE